MPIKAQITKETFDSVVDTKVHFIPASIDGNELIKVDEYFNSYNFTEESVQVNSLRGYPLKGTEVSLSENLQGLILRESERLQIDGTERELKFGGKFSKFVYWNYDKNPSQNDCYQKALHWIKCSEALHTEIDSIEDDNSDKKTSP